MLRHKADLRSLAFVAIFFSLVTVNWVFEMPLALRIPLVMLTCVFSFFCAVITHNTVHAPVFRSRILNNLFHHALTLGYGHPVSAYVPGHNLSHHKWMQTRRDVMRTTKLRFRWNLLNQLFFLHHPRVSQAIMKAEVDYLMSVRKTKPRWFRQAMAETVVWLGTYAGLIAIDWKKFLLYVLIPHTYAAWGIVSINYVQHDGCDPDHPYNHSRNITGKLVNWFVFNNGFHGIHHMYPSLHWSLAPQKHAELIAPHIHPNLDQKSLLAFIWRAYVWPGKRLNYLGEPVKIENEGPDEPWIPGTPGVPKPPPAVRTNAAPATL